MTTEAQPHATIAQVRQNMVANCRWAVAHHNQINYAEIRPSPLIPPRTLPFTTDCSGFAERLVTSVERRARRGAFCLLQMLGAPTHTDSAT